MSFPQKLKFSVLDWIRKNVHPQKITSYTVYDILMLFMLLTKLCDGICSYWVDGLYI